MSEYQDIVDKNKKYTYFSWSAQEAANPIAIEKAKGIISGTTMENSTLIFLHN